jgi:transcriptional regulator with PAS, ATPase and Fis domain
MRIVSPHGTRRRPTGPTPDRPRGRDRRPTLPTILLSVLTESGPPRSADTLVARVADLLRARCPLRALDLDRGSSGRAPGTVVGLSTLTLRFPPAAGVPGALTAVFEPGYRPDPWVREWLDGLSAVVALCARADQSRPLVPAVHSASPHAGTHQRLIGRSAAMAVVWDRIARYAAVDDSVLIVGASGTGKELVAREIHDRSARARRRFLPINCGALVSTLLETELFGVEPGTATGVRGHGGAFEEARGGTLFFDEVTELSEKGQVSLLRVLQERTVTPVGGHRTVPVDVRIIAATNQALDPLVADGRFREDLVYRLRVLPLLLPPLRERGTDVVALAQVFLEDDPRSWPWELRPAATEALLDCDWPGNVRQLQSAMHLIRALASSPVVDLPLVEQALTDLGVRVPAPSERSLTAEEMAAHHARTVLQSCGGNKTRAAARLGISLPTLRARLRHRDGPRIAQHRRRAA